MTTPINHTHFGPEDCLVDLLNDPNELSAVDSLHEGITDVSRVLCTEWRDDDLSSGKGGLGAESFLQVCWRDLRKGRERKGGRRDREGGKGGKKRESGREREREGEGGREEERGKGGIDRR